MVSSAVDSQFEQVDSCDPNTKAGDRAVVQPDDGLPTRRQKVPRGTVYLWHPNPSDLATAGKLEKANVPLHKLDHPTRLSGRFVTVHNDTVTKLPGSHAVDGVTLGDAVPNPDGNYLFEPHHGGGRMERHPFAEPDMWQRYVDASRFGEVNAYYHINAVASYVDQLLHELGYPSLPPVVVRVNAHNAIASHQGCCDGVVGKKSNKWFPMQGGHYRLPTHRRLTVVEYQPLCPSGEIHLGPGWRLTEHGALANFVGGKYRCNASHNAGTIYHEYGHHLTRHTADFRANAMKAPHRQCNYKTDLDEAFCDYLAATTMNSPHIWAFHHQHDAHAVHRRSLVSTETMDDYDFDKHADPHDNGTILASTLWDFRQSLVTATGSDAKQNALAIRDADILVVASLTLIGQLQDHLTSPTVSGSRRLRKGFGTVRQAMLEADQRLFAGVHEREIREAFAARKIKSGHQELLSKAWSSHKSSVLELPLSDPKLQKLQRIDPQAIVPPTSDLLSSSQLDAALCNSMATPYSLVAVGDVMVGSRARHRTNEFGPDYIFECVKPLFRRASIVLGNQEGPIAQKSPKLKRNHSYKVSPQYTRVLRRAGFNVLTLANNHLLDCGREGVRETLTSLEKHGIHAIGVGEDVAAAHQPAIVGAGKYTVGLLGYYWNRRTAARNGKPGSAIDTPEHLTADIERLRPLVDRLVVTVHWGVPYEREPSQADREKAHLMISLGADIVIGHHPHIMQEVEVYQERPIIYSVGNFAFGTGNSKAESLLVGVQFQSDRTITDFYPVYVKNRDPRVNYQPKIMTGASATESLRRLSELCSHERLQIANGVGRLISSPHNGEDRKIRS